MNFKTRNGLKFLHNNPNLYLGLLAFNCISYMLKMGLGRASNYFSTFKFNSQGKNNVKGRPLRDVEGRGCERRRPGGRWPGRGTRRKTGASCHRKSFRSVSEVSGLSGEKFRGLKNDFKSDFELLRHPTLLINASMPRKP